MRFLYENALLAPGAPLTYFFFFFSALPFAPAAGAAARFAAVGPEDAFGAAAARAAGLRREFAKATHGRHRNTSKPSSESSK